MMAVCDYCEKEMMNEGISCIDNGSMPNDLDKPCHDCNCRVGGFHHPGCDMERCSKCSGQRISCDCE